MGTAKAPDMQVLRQFDWRALLSKIFQVAHLGVFWEVVLAASVFAALLSQAILGLILEPEVAYWEDFPVRVELHVALLATML